MDLGWVKLEGSMEVRYTVLAVAGFTVRRYD